jgi:hypothetical protein
MAFRPIRGYSAPGRYPATEDQARNLFRNLKHNGLAGAFTKVNGRVLINPERLDELLAEQASGSTGGRDESRV